jgi:hypothetical protein
MTDIVKRLCDPSRGSPRWGDTMDEAAYEIERLRCIIDTVHPQMQATIDRLTKDNADLSEACADGWGQARKRQDQVRNLEAELQDWKAAYHADTKRIEAERDRLQKALQSVLDACDQGRMVERGAGGMTLEAQIRRSVYNNVPAWPIEEARAALKELDHD